ncbi:MAG TPA: TIGR01777 family oxidoreductase [Candidatus Limnocylindrales bacterium]|jgi:uncharacterized protein (TIGR01777 family)|nr:TIGR01777 family oxidoreductase [Candidatus Limnocylindrales bacterium]
MRIVITGGTGLVGRALGRSLIADGHEVVALSRDAGRARGLPPGLVARDWSSSDIVGLASSIDGADAVVSLAGTPVGPWPWTRRRKASIRDSRVDGVAAIVGAIERLPASRRPRSLVVVSGVDAYPESEPGPDPTPMTEDSPMGSGFLAQVSRDVEHEAIRAAALGLRVTRMRMGHVLARDAQLVRLLALPVRLFVGGRVGSGRQWMSWVHIDDAVALFRLAIGEGGPGGVLNVVAPNPCRQIEFVRAMAAVLHRPTWFPIPAAVVRLALGEESALLLESRRVAPARAQASGVAFRFATIDQAMRAVLG